MIIETSFETFLQKKALFSNEIQFTGVKLTNPARKNISMVKSTGKRN
jgi:hypothetical protein